MKKSKIVAMISAGLAGLGVAASAQNLASGPAAAARLAPASVTLEKPAVLPICPLTVPPYDLVCGPGSRLVADSRNCSWTCAPSPDPMPRPMGPRPEVESRSLGHYQGSVSEISKSLGKDDFGQVAEELGHVFENSSGQEGSSDLSVSAAGSGGSATAAPTLNPATSSPKIDDYQVPAPAPSSPESSEGGWPLAGAGAGALAAAVLLFGAKKRARFVLVDEHTDPNSARNNPQHDPNVARGWNENQNRNRGGDSVNNSSGTITNGNNYTGGNSLPPSGGGGGPIPRWVPPQRVPGR